MQVQTVEINSKLYRYVRFQFRAFLLLCTSITESLERDSREEESQRSLENRIKARFSRPSFSHRFSLTFSCESSSRRLRLTRTLMESYRWHRSRNKFSTRTFEEKNIYLYCMVIDEVDQKVIRFALDNFSSPSHE